MNASSYAVSGDSGDDVPVVMHGESHDDSIFVQIGSLIIQERRPDPIDVRYSLPPDTASFTGREAEVGRITGMVSQAAGLGGIVAIQAIDGMPGVGKTALAVHAAHILRDRFPGRQLFINLHAHTPDRDPVAPTDALAGLLVATGLDPRNLPLDLDGRAGLWRDRMAGQRALLVLDNAASSAQVVPLLPGDGGCLVLVTSRRHLGDLPGAALPLLLDVLPPDRALEMFIRLARRAKFDNPDDVTSIVQMVGFLPLAISLLARVYAKHPAWTLADLASETRESALTLKAEEDTVAAALETSYRHLGADSQRFICLLGLSPTLTVDAYAAAALAGTSPDESAVHLDILHGEGLLTETGYRRYGMHDLIRRYARNRAAANPTPDHEGALGRLLDYYEAAVSYAEAHLARQTRPAAGLSVRATMIAVPHLADYSHALAWTRAERDNAFACLDYAARIGQNVRIVGITIGLAAILQQDGPWADAMARHDTAIRAAQHIGDKLGEAGALTYLGSLRRMTGDYPGAMTVLEEALGIYGRIDNLLGQANALVYLGDVRRLSGEYREAAGILERARDIYRDIGDRLGQISALNYLGAVRRMTGDYPGAADVLEEALAIGRELGDRLGLANALLYLGAVRRMTGDYPGAADVLEEALAIGRELDDRLGLANALLYLGAVRRMTGDYPGAAKAFEEALSIYHDLGDRLGQANALNNLGDARLQLNDHLAAVSALETALGIYRDIGSRLGQANVQLRLGVVLRRANNYADASAALGEALIIYRDLGDQGGQTEALNEIGVVRLACHDTVGAESFHREALILARTIDSPWDEAHALAGLGRCALANGDTAKAGHDLRQARILFQNISAPEAAEIADQIANIAVAGQDG